MYHLKYLSHKYAIDGLRIWQTNSVLFTSTLSDSDVGFSTNISKNHQLDLENFEYRYLVIFYRGHPMSNMFVRTENASHGTNGTNQRRLIGGIDYQMLSLLQKHFGWRIKMINSFSDAHKDPLWQGNPSGMLSDNLADQISGNFNINGVWHVVSYVVPNFFELNIGYDFYTAPPIKLPAWAVSN